jgi:hypothetical protein
MPALAFTDQRARLRRILQNALTNATYESSEREPDGRTLVLHALRAGRGVTVTFRGVRDSKANQEPSPGAPVSLNSVHIRSGLIALLDFLLPDRLFPNVKSVTAGYARVRIDAGAARLDIVCQDAEWWEEEAPQA